MCNVYSYSWTCIRLIHHNFFSSYHEENKLARFKSTWSCLVLFKSLFNLRLETYYYAHLILVFMSVSVSALARQYNFLRLLLHRENIASVRLTTISFLV